MTTVFLYQHRCQACNIRYFQQQASNPSPALHTPALTPTATVNFAGAKVGAGAPSLTSAAAVGNNAPDTSIL
jgi:hypothetical protein